MHNEIRHTSQSQASARLATRADGTRTFAGYAAVHYSASDPGTQYTISPDIVERIRPGAFDRAIREKHDVRFLVDHDSTCLLARVSSGTLRLSVDSKGLFYQADVDDRDFDHQRILPKVERGDLSGASFAFRATSISWEETPDGMAIRWIEDLDLMDVSVVSFPAYPATTASVRSTETIEQLRKELTTWRESKGDWRIKYHEMMKMKIASAAASKPAKDWRQKWMKMQKDKLQWKR